MNGDKKNLYVLEEQKSEKEKLSPVYVKLPYTAFSHLYGALKFMNLHQVLKDEFAMSTAGITEQVNIYSLPRYILTLSGNSNQKWKK